MRRISLLVPLYNEEDSIDPFMEAVLALGEVLKPSYQLEVVCVNDGSTDRTLQRLMAHKSTSPNLSIIDLSRNFGKEAALTAGFDFAKGDAVIPIDVDLQHPFSLIEDMVRQWEAGYEVVLAKRKSRETDHWFYRSSARLFYRLSGSITQIPIPADIGDFRLMDRKVVDALKQLREQSRFMKGLYAWTGFRSTTLEYEVDPRRHGLSKFNTWKLWNLALDGITSFSTLPLRIWTYIGSCVSLVALSYAAYLLVKTLVFGADTPGYASLMVTLLFLSGVQLIGIGVLGEYIGRTFLEAKNRPVYIIRDVL